MLPEEPPSRESTPPPPPPAAAVPENGQQALTSEVASRQDVDVADQSPVAVKEAPPLVPTSPVDATAPVTAGPIQPAPPEDSASTEIITDAGKRHRLYVSYFFAAWGDRMWEFAAVVFLLEIFPTTLLPASLFGFFESASGIALGPRAGRFIDDHNRLTVLRTSIFGQNIAVAVAGFVFFITLSMLDESNTPWKVTTVVIVIFAGMVAKVFSGMNKISIHKDWCVVLAGGDSSLQTALNSVMRRVDLTCSIVAPLLVGLLSFAVGAAHTCAFVGIWATCSTFVELYFANAVYQSDERLHIKPPPRPSSPQIVTGNEKSPPTGLLGKTAACFGSSWAAFRRYVEHRAFAVSLPYCLLYASVLSFHTVLVAFLRTLGTSDLMLAVGRALAAFVAISSTFAIGPMIRRMGIDRTGMVTVWSQVACLTPLAIAFIVVRSFEDRQQVWFIAVIFVTVCLSRFGLWGFDLAQTQLMQELIDPSETGAINGSQETLMNFCYLISYGYTIVFHDPRDFLWPALLSYVAILASGILFARYTASEEAFDAHEFSAKKSKTASTSDPEKHSV